MPIVSSDVPLKLSVTTGSAGSSTAQGNPNNSLGKYISTTSLSGTALNNLFDDISGDEQAAGTVDYRCLFIVNNHGSITYSGVKFWLSGLVCSAVGSTNVITSVGHGLAAGDTVRVEAELATDAIPSGLDNTTTYYLISVTTDTFKLSTTLGGSQVDIGDSSRFIVYQYGNTSIAIGLDGTGATDYNSSSAQAVTIASETDAPSGVSFSSPRTKSAGLSLGNLAAGKCYAVWVRRTALNVGARNVDGLGFGYSGDTGA